MNTKEKTNGGTASTQGAKAGKMNEASLTSPKAGAVNSGGANAAKKGEPKSIIAAKGGFQGAKFSSPAVSAQSRSNGNAGCSCSSGSSGCNPYLPENVEIIGINHETTSVNTFKLKKKLAFTPGQFVEVGLPGYGEAPFGISSSPFADYTEITVKQRGLLTNKLFELKEGDSLQLRGPYGNGFPIKEMKGKHVVIVGGGTGIAPLRALVGYLMHDKSACTEFRFFAGARTPDDMLFHKDLCVDWRKGGAKVCLTVDAPSRSWHEEVGTVIRSIEKSKLDPDGIAVLCGPPVMMKLAADALKKKGFAEDNIYVSLERLMRCGVGKCGHCMMGGKLICRNGPVFRFNEIKEISEEE